MKIGFFTEAYDPIQNGVVHAIKNFKSGLEKLNYEVYIFCPTYRNYVRNYKDKNIYPVKSTPLPGKSGYHKIYNFEKKIKKITKTLDIFHAHHPFFMGKKVQKLAREQKKQMVFTNHTQYEQYAHYLPVFSSFGKIYNKDLPFYSHHDGG